jgi:5-methylcytosine-specific restriction endonuclease McrA
VGSDPAIVGRPEVGYRRCSTPGCDRALGLQKDHRFPVGKGGWTALDNLQLLCRSCHEAKTKREYPNGTAYLRRRRDSQPAA